MSHSWLLRERNMMFVPLLICESVVGGERMLMSMAVPLRMGTNGVSSRPIKGETPSGLGEQIAPSPAVAGRFGDEE